MKKALVFQNTGLLILLCLWLDIPKEPEQYDSFSGTYGHTFLTVCPSLPLSQFFSQLEDHCGKHERVSPGSRSREDCCPSTGVLSVDGLYLSDPSGAAWAAESFFTRPQAIPRAARIYIRETCRSPDILAWHRQLGWVLLLSELPTGVATVSFICPQVQLLPPPNPTSYFSSHRCWAPVNILHPNSISVTASEKPTCDRL